MSLSRSRLDSDEADLKNKLDDMFDHASSALVEAIESLQTLDKERATRVSEQAATINRMQEQIEERSSLVIALQQPVAGDLRNLMSDIFISMELARIGGHAAAIAGIVNRMQTAPKGSQLQPILDMSGSCMTMLEKVKQAYDDMDTKLIEDIAGLDDQIDSAEEAYVDYMISEICSKKSDKGTCTYLMWISHNLERVGDRATNIAERVVYMNTGNKPSLN